MNPRNTGGPAFPGPSPLGTRPGMDLRDYFAASAMQALITRPDCNVAHSILIAQAAYGMADDMLRARVG